MTQENPPKFVHPPAVLDDEAEYQRILRFIKAVQELPGQLDKLLHFNGDFKKYDIRAIQNIRSLNVFGEDPLFFMIALGILVTANKEISKSEEVGELRKYAGGWYTPEGEPKCEQTNQKYLQLWEKACDKIHMDVFNRYGEVEQGYLWQHNRTEFDRTYEAGRIIVMEQPETMVRTVEGIVQRVFEEDYPTQEDMKYFI